jgi:hypothetical protein
VVSAGSIWPHEEHVDAVDRKLLEEASITLTVDDLTFLSGAHFRIPLSGNQLHHVCVYAGSVHVPYVIANFRTLAKVEQAVVSQSVIYRDGTYVVPATLDIDGLTHTPSAMGLLKESRRKFEILHFGSARLELLSGQHAMCLLLLLEHALLAIPDEDVHVFVSITPDPTHHGCTFLSDVMAFHFPSPTRTPLVTGEDVRSAPRPEIPWRQVGTSPACPCSPSLYRYTQAQDDMHTSGCYEPDGFPFRSGPRNASPPALSAEKTARPATCRRTSPPDNHFVQ